MPEIAAGSATRTGVHTIGHWNYRSGVRKDIFVVSSAERVELFVNGLHAASMRLAAGGASCGVMQSSNLATRRHEIKALVWLSGAASDEAKAYIASAPGLFVFGAASEGDTDAAKAIRAAVETSKNPQSQLKIYSGSEHGVPMFGKNPDLEPLIVSWLKARFTVRP